MERIDRAFVVLAALVFIVYLIWMATPRDKAKVPDVRVMLPASTQSDATGAAYLTSNLPIERESDDNMRSVSIGKFDSYATGATAI